MNTDLVSVIIPCYNATSYLRACVESVLRQTYQNIEILIIDDCSTQTETHQVLCELELSDSRIKIFYLNKNAGPAVARNIGIAHAHGRYIAFCDSDDMWHPVKLERQIAFMQEKRCALCSSSYYIVNEANSIIGIFHSPSKITYQMYKRDNKIGCLTAIYDTKQLGKKYYMPLINKRQDWGLFMRILKDIKICYPVTQPLAYYRKHQNSISSNKTSLITYNISIYKQVLGYSTLKACLFFLFGFLPTYFIKVAKVKWDSYRLRKKQTLNINVDY